MERIGWIITLILPIVILGLPVQSAHAIFVSDEECIEKIGRECFCFETGTCEFTSDPLTTMLIPFDSIFGGLSIVIFWSVLIGILWLRTENPQLVGIVGIAMVSAYMAYIESSGLTTTQEFETARIIGATLIVVSFGISVYQLLINRILSGPQ
tara:strand:- start:249 stop:707 length:459 start_codon:yes stop_codon:yes gene_type:complete